MYGVISYVAAASPFSFFFIYGKRWKVYVYIVFFIFLFWVENEYNVNIRALETPVSNSVQFRLGGFVRRERNLVRGFKSGWEQSRFALQHSRSACL